VCTCVCVEQMRRRRAALKHRSATATTIKAKSAAKRAVEVEVGATVATTGTKPRIEFRIPGRRSALAVPPPPPQAFEACAGRVTHESPVPIVAAPTSECPLTRAPHTTAAVVVAVPETPVGVVDLRAPGDPRHYYGVNVDEWEHNIMWTDGDPGSRPSGLVIDIERCQNPRLVAADWLEDILWGDEPRSPETPVGPLIDRGEVSSPHSLSMSEQQACVCVCVCVLGSSCPFFWRARRL